MKIRLHNNNTTDFVEFKGTEEEINRMVEEKMREPNWREGWSEGIY